MGRGGGEGAVTIAVHRYVAEILGPAVLQSWLYG